MLKRFRRQVARYWFVRWDSTAKGGPPGRSWEKLFDHWLPAPHIVHDYPDARFRASRVRVANPK
jgi:hypothetical protein